MSKFRELSAEERESVLTSMWRKRGLDRFITLRSFDNKVSEGLVESAGVPTYYPVQFDGKGRQYMGGYPLSPQGSKTYRPLFKAVVENEDTNTALHYITVQAADLFGSDWSDISMRASELVEAGYLSPATIAACSTNGKPDIAKLAVLREFVRLTQIGEHNA